MFGLTDPDDGLSHVILMTGPPRYGVEVQANVLLQQPSSLRNIDLWLMKLIV